MLRNSSHTLGIEGLKRVIKNHKFSVSDRVQKWMDEYEENNNPIIGFFRECEDENFQIENEPTNKVYRKYQEYCIVIQSLSLLVPIFSPHFLLIQIFLNILG